MLFLQCFLKNKKLIIIFINIICFIVLFYLKFCTEVKKTKFVASKFVAKVLNNCSLLW